MNPTGEHKINNTIGQVLLAKRMGKKRIIAETGAGQHGVATGLTAPDGPRVHCVPRRGGVRRQRFERLSHEAFGRRSRTVMSGTRTLKDATNEAIRALGHERPRHVLHPRQRRRATPVPRDGSGFSSVIGEETKAQLLEVEGRELPDAVVAWLVVALTRLGFSRRMPICQITCVHG